MIKLFLDDEREAWNDSWDVVRTPLEFKAYINDNKELPKIISFDHDLHAEHYNNAMYRDAEEYNKLYKQFKHETGLDCAKWLCQYCVEQGIKIPIINVHSTNPIGSTNIANTIMNYLMFYYGEEIIIQPKPYNSVEP